MHGKSRICTFPIHWWLYRVAAFDTDYLDFHVNILKWLAVEFSPFGVLMFIQLSIKMYNR